MAALAPQMEPCRVLGGWKQEGRGLDQPSAPRPKGRSLFCLDNRLAARQQADEEQDDRYHKENVQKRADRVRADEAEQPGNQEYHRERIQHRFLPSCGKKKQGAVRQPSLDCAGTGTVGEVYAGRAR